MKHLVIVTVLCGAMATGCNVSKEGAFGNVTFTPRDCGRVAGCDFDDSVGVGGRLNLQIMGIDGFSTAGVELDSDDPQVLSVVPVADVGGRPTWQLVGEGAGVARISAWQGAEEVDFIEVGVQQLSGLTLEKFVGDAVGPDTSDPNYDEVWIVNADAETSFFVVPLIGSGVPTMGVYDYTPELDATMDDALIDQDGILTGYLYFNVGAGEHHVAFQNDYARLDVLIDAQ